MGPPPGGRPPPSAHLYVPVGGRREAPTDHTTPPASECDSQPGLRRPGRVRGVTCWSAVALPTSAHPGCVHHRWSHSLSSLLSPLQRTCLLVAVRSPTVGSSFARGLHERPWVGLVVRRAMGRVVGRGGCAAPTPGADWGGTARDGPAKAALPPHAAPVGRVSGPRARRGARCLGPMPTCAPLRCARACSSPALTASVARAPSLCLALTARLVGTGFARRTTCRPRTPARGGLRRPATWSDGTAVAPFASRADASPAAPMPKGSDPIPQGVGWRCAASSASLHLPALRAGRHRSFLTAAAAPLPLRGPPARGSDRRTTRLRSSAGCGIRLELWSRRPAIEAGNASLVGMQPGGSTSRPMPQDRVGPRILWSLRSRRTPSGLCGPGANSL